MTRLYLALGLVLALTGLGAGAFLWGRHVENQAWENRALQRSVEVLRERKELNDAVRNMDDAALCRNLGGEFKRMPNGAPGQCL